MIKEKINRIDFDLKNLFEEVSIVEKSNKNDFYFEINASSTIEFNGDKKRASVKAKISKPDLNSSLIKWSYLTNPVNESSDLIDRYSTIETISKDIFDVVSKKKMVSTYFESLNSILELINESVVNESNVSTEEKEELEKKLEEIVKRFELESQTNESKYEDNVMVKKMTFRNNLKPSDLYMLDLNLKTIGIEPKYTTESIEICIL